MRKRLSIVDLWKFIATLMIMIYHVYYLGKPFSGEEYIGRLAWIWVEFFLALTGYFTYKHFLNSERHNNIFKNAIKYTIRKFKVFIPYTTVSITLAYILSAEYTLLKNDTLKFFSHFKTYPFEVLLVGELVQSKQVLGPIWFLSAMLLVFPLVTVLCQLKNKYFTIIISGLCALLYYGLVDFGSRIWPNDILRAFCGIMLGVFVCGISDLFLNGRKMNKVIVTVIEMACMLFATLVTLFNLDDFKRLVVFSFAVAISLMLSGKSATASFSNSVVSKLGFISMPMFIWQKVVAMLIVRFENYVKLTPQLKISLFFVGTTIMAVLSYTMVEGIKKKKE